MTKDFVTLAVLYSDKQNCSGNSLNNTKVQRHLKKSILEMSCINSKFWNHIGDICYCWSMPIKVENCHAGGKLLL